MSELELIISYATLSVFITCTIADSSVFDDVVTVENTEGVDLLL